MPAASFCPAAIVSNDMVLGSPFSVCMTAQIAPAIREPSLPSGADRRARRPLSRRPLEDLGGGALLRDVEPLELDAAPGGAHLAGVEAEVGGAQLLHLLFFAPMIPLSVA